MKITGLRAGINDLLIAYDTARAMTDSAKKECRNILTQLDDAVNATIPQELKALEAYRGDFYRYFGKPSDAGRVNKHFQTAMEIKTPRHPDLDLLVGEYGFYQLHMEGDASSAIITFEDTLNSFPTRLTNKTRLQQRSRFHHAANMAELSIFLESGNKNLNSLDNAIDYANRSIKDAERCNDPGTLWNADKSIAMTYVEKAKLEKLPRKQTKYLEKASDSVKAFWDHGLVTDEKSERNMIAITALYTHYIDGWLSHLWKEVGFLYADSVAQHREYALNDLKILSEGCVEAVTSKEARDVLKPNERKIPYVIHYVNELENHPFFAEEAKKDSKVRKQMRDVKKYMFKSAK